jgi:hypothetical protein
MLPAILVVPGYLGGIFSTPTYKLLIENGLLLVTFLPNGEKEYRLILHCYKQTKICTPLIDNVSEWLRRQTRIPAFMRDISVGFGRAGSSPVVVDILFFF